MTTNLFANASAQAAAASPSEAAGIADMEGAKLGAAAERKRREEASASLDAALESHAANGRGVIWHRRIRANGEIRHVAMVERDGAYSERSFLRLCNQAARAAGKGRLRWDAQAVDAIAAELCLSILSETAGRMPRRGSLGRREGYESADAAYLTTCAARIIAQALKGEKRRAGLAAEIEPMAAADGAHLAAGSDLLADSLSAAEIDPDRYLAETAPEGFRPVSEWSASEWRQAERLAEQSTRVLAPDAHRALRDFADGIGKRPAAVIAAIVAAVRLAGSGTGGRDQAADLAAAGYAASAGAFRKAAATGREILRDVWETAPKTADEAAKVEALAAALERFCELEGGAYRPTGTAPISAKGSSLSWPERVKPAEVAPVSSPIRPADHWANA